jgi:hypothetical protein
VNSRVGAIAAVAIAWLAAGPAAAQDAGSGRASSAGPVFVVYSAGNPGQSRSLGLVPDVLVALGEKANAPYLAQLLERTQSVDLRERLGAAFACTFAADAAAGCEHVELLDRFPVAQSADDPLLRAMRERSLERAWVLNVTEQFYKAGYNFGVGATEFEIRNGALEAGRELRAMYMHSYSAAGDAVSRGLPRDAKSATPRFGSKEARTSFWLAGDPAQIEKLIAAAPAGAAAQLRELAARSAEVPLTKERLAAQTAALPTLGDLEKRGEAACAVYYCNLRVYAQDEDRIQAVGFIGQWPYAVSVNRWGFE